MATSKNKGGTQTSRAKPSSYSQMYKNAAAGAPPKPVVPATNAAARVTVSDTPARLKTSDEVNWRQEYAYVIGDLTRLGLVTAGLIVAIIVAGLFI